MNEMIRVTAVMEIEEENKNDLLQAFLENYQTGNEMVIKENHAVITGKFVKQPDGIPRIIEIIIKNSKINTLVISEKLEIKDVIGDILGKELVLQRKEMEVEKTKQNQTSQNEEEESKQNQTSKNEEEESKQNQTSKNEEEESKQNQISQNEEESKQKEKDFSLQLEAIAQKATNIEDFLKNVSDMFDLEKFRDQFEEILGFAMNRKPDEKIKWKNIEQYMSQKNKTFTDYNRMYIGGKVKEVTGKPLLDSLIKISSYKNYQFRKPDVEQYINNVLHEMEIEKAKGSEEIKEYIAKMLCVAVQEEKGDYRIWCEKAGIPEKDQLEVKVATASLFNDKMKVPGVDQMSTEGIVLELKDGLKNNK